MFFFVPILFLFSAFRPPAAGPLHTFFFFPSTSCTAHSSFPSQNRNHAAGLHCQHKRNYETTLARPSYINRIHFFSPSNSPYLNEYFCRFLLPILPLPCVLSLLISSAYLYFCSLLCFSLVFAKSMADVLTGAAANTISNVVTVAIAPLIQIIDDVINLEQNSQLLQENLSSLKVLLHDISNQFQNDQRSPPDTVNNWLQRLQRSHQEARSLIDRSQRQKQCLNCLFCKPKPGLAREVREWNTNLDQLLSNLLRDFSIFSSTQQIVLSAPQRAEALLQPVPELGFVGLRIQEAETMVQTWLNMEDLQFRVIGIYGLGGIGKTSLLRNVYNSCKKGNFFPLVIWITVSQSINLLSMQSDIAEAINLDLGSSSNAETRKMKLFTSLKERKFLLVLDDVWSPLDLPEVGVPVGNDKGSRVIISTRSTDVIRKMGAKDYSIKIEPLSQEEAWELFCRKAFKDGTVPTKGIEDVARLIAAECKGLPLAINVIAAAVMGNESVDEWNLALAQIKNVDPDFVTSSGIEKDLYQRLKWSYNCLPNPNFQKCFLYCGAFREDEEIDVERLVEMWIGESFVCGGDPSYIMDKGRSYVKQLVERCLFEDIYGDMRFIKVHDIVRDMAIHIAEDEGNCLFGTSQNLQNLHDEKGIDKLKRIAIHGQKDIPFLPTDLTCPNLLALLLGHNKGLTAVPNGFFVNVTTLRVLDMSYTNIESLPVSMWHLTQLEFLDLSGTSIKNLPEDICNLVRLQFLHLRSCGALESLPSQIGELKSLKHLDLEGCQGLTDLPCEISQLAALYKLNIWMIAIALKTEEAGSGVCSLKDLTNIPNLMELSVKVKAGMEVDGNGIRSGIEVGIMGSWPEMRHLRLEFDVENGPDDDVVTEDLPQDMQNMEKLQSFVLWGYCGRRLPNCICDFKQLESLRLFDCFQLSELPLLERLPNLKSLELINCKKLRELGIGRWGSEAGFPMLEELLLDDLPELESMRSSSSNIVWSEGLMPELRRLSIIQCPSLKRVPKETAKLPKLKEIVAEEDWWENLIWEDDNVPNLLKDKLTWTW